MQSPEQIPKEPNVSANKAGKKKLSAIHANIHKKSLSHTRKHLSRRTKSLKNSNTKRFIIKFGFAFSLLILVGTFLLPRAVFYGTKTSFVPGSQAVVGVVDPETNTKLNPFTLQSSSELGLGSLLFSSLLTYDKSGSLQGDLAKSFKIDAESKKITFELKDKIVWHDGSPLSLSDLTFTIQTLKKHPSLNPELNKPLSNIEISKEKGSQLELTFSKSSAGLDDLFTKIKIVPRHIFEPLLEDGTQPGDLDYSKLAIGSGPLQASSALESRSLKSLDVQSNNQPEGSYKQLSLQINPKYYGNGAQSNLIFRIFHTPEALQDAANKNLVSLAIFTSGQSPNVNMQSKHINTSSSVFAFLNNSSPFLSLQPNRKALSEFTNSLSIANSASAVKVVSSPVPGLGDKDPNAELIGNTEKARASFGTSGWSLQPNNTLSKDSQPLVLNIATDEEAQNIKAAESLKSQWQKLGIDCRIQNYSASELQTEILPKRSYDVLIIAISTSEISDPAVYWSSDQIKEKGLNFSNYSSSKADADLNIAKSKLNAKERRERLARFVQRWQEDSPAIGLFSKNLTLNYNSNSVDIEGLPAGVISYQDLFPELTNLKANKSRIVVME